MGGQMLTELVLGGRVASSFRRSMAQTKSSLDNLGSASDRINRNMARGGVRAMVEQQKYYGRAARKHRELMAQIRKASAGQSLAAQVQRYRGVLNKLHAAQRRLGKSTVSIDKAIHKVGGRYKEAKRQARAYGLDLNNLGRSQENLRAKVERTSRSMERLYHRGRRFRAAGFGILKMAQSRGGALVALAVGGGGLAAARAVGNREESLVRLMIQARAAKEDIDKLNQSFYRVAKNPEIRVKRDSLVDAARKILEKTGDLNLAQENMENIGYAISASGARGGDIGALVASLKDQFGLEKPEDIRKALGVMVGQEKAGAFTLADQARLIERVTSAYRSLGLTGQQAVKDMGALLQVFRKGTGSSEQAATSFEAVMRLLVDKASEIESLGVEVWDWDKSVGDRKTARPVPEILKDVLDATGGDIVAINEVFGGEAGRGIRALLNKMNDKGEIPLLEKLRKQQSDGKELLEDSARVARTFNAAMRSLNSTWEEFSDDVLTVPLKKVAAATDALGETGTTTALGTAVTGGVLLGGAYLGGKLRRGYRGARKWWMGEEAYSQRYGKTVPKSSGITGKLARRKAANAAAKALARDGAKVGAKAVFSKAAKVAAKAVSSKATKAAAKVGAKAAFSKAGKTAGKAGAGLLAKGLGKIGIKTLGKSVAKAIPIAGVIAGTAFAVQRAMDGQWGAAAAEMASGIAGAVGLGLAGVAIDLGVAAMDVADAADAGDAEEKAAPVAPQPKEPLKAKASGTEVGKALERLLYKIEVHITQIVNLAPDMRLPQVKQTLDEGREGLRRTVAGVMEEIFWDQNRTSFGNAGY